MKIIIVDDNEFYRNYLRMILPLLEGVSEVMDLTYNEETVQQLGAEKPDVLIFDPCRENQVDLGLFGKMKSEVPDCNLIAYLEPDHEAHGETLFRMGVSNVLSKSSGTEYLRYILRQLLRQMGADVNADHQTLSQLAEAGKSMELVHTGVKPLKAAPDKPADGRSASSFGITTTELEPTEHDESALSGLRMKLLRKRENADEDASKATNSFKKIWAEKKRTGTSSGNGRFRL